MRQAGGFPFHLPLPRGATAKLAAQRTPTTGSDLATSSSGGMSHFDYSAWSAVLANGEVVRINGECGRISGRGSRSSPS